MRISDGLILAGTMRGRDFEEAMLWARRNRRELLRAWDDLNKRG